MSGYKNALWHYRDSTGLTNEEIASQLSALLGKKIGAGAVAHRANVKKTPPAWAAALDLVDDESPTIVDEQVYLKDTVENAHGSVPRVESEPPTMPQGAKIAEASKAIVNHRAAVERIAMFYGTIGSGASIATGNKGIEDVFDAYAMDLAQGWVSAAPESKFAARVVALANSGGPMGDLVFAHIILVFGLIYVSGNGPDQLGAVLGGKGDKFRPYREAAQRSRAAAEQEAHIDGSATFGSENPLA